ncbi:AAA family ATPase [Salipiger mucosus]|uniref:Aminoglycoside phosphotransferase domain-containing protein n=1 Tax=Salipiger mucosus DSM 16094 TaxID=1123237 RepID=S9QJ84_9RHOB|nr:bifunctional aminoglycoside phosphotransferase/ATP-binding protein [Salipiger mucosus]EPX79603.1 hypothetical protein Salmuc_05543 [Salipiger mucosus DSM 16094]
MSDEQTEVIALLDDPATHGGAEVTHLQTHGAHVFLAGDAAWKIKRAVAYNYMDFSTLEAREAALRRELELNQPVAPEIYHDVVPITRAPDGGLQVDGSGPTVEWLLRMRRFPKEDELSAVAERGALDDAMAEALGRSTAAYHARAPRREAAGAQLIAEILDELETAFADMTAELGDDAIRGFVTAARTVFEAQAPLLDARAAAGHVRRCHGDLHLHNIVLIDGRPVPFDALEFDETLGTCDVLYDLAFLLMDMAHRALPRAACITLSAWLLEAGGTEDAGLAALPLFLAVRAAIRAMVEVQTTRAAGGDAGEARRYLEEARGFLAPAAPRLVLVGGLSGSGKTTVARGLAPLLGPTPGAVHLRSDTERKRLAGVAPLERLPQAAYDPAVSRTVYDTLIARAETILQAGRSVIIDAAWLDAEARDRLEERAARLDVPFARLWLEAPAETLAERVSTRRGDASDADAGVVRAQLAGAKAPADWPRVDASGSPRESLERAALRLGL